MTFNTNNKHIDISKELLFDNISIGHYKIIIHIEDSKTITLDFRDYESINQFTEMLYVMKKHTVTPKIKEKKL